MIHGLVLLVDFFPRIEAQHVCAELTLNCDLFDSYVIQKPIS